MLAHYAPSSAKLSLCTGVAQLLLLVLLQADATRTELGIVHDVSHPVVVVALPLCRSDRSAAPVPSAVPRIKSLSATPFLHLRRHVDQPVLESRLGHHSSDGSSKQASSSWQARMQQWQQQASWSPRGPRKRKRASSEERWRASSP